MTDEAKRPMAYGMDGWVIVPLEPTIAMIEAWEAAIPSDDDEKWAAENQTSELDSLECTYARTDYRGFLAGAPAHPAFEAVAKLVETLQSTRSQLITLGGDPRSAIADDGSYEGDMIQAAILDLIDAALAPFLPKESNPHG